MAPASPAAIAVVSVRIVGVSVSSTAGPGRATGERGTNRAARTSVDGTATEVTVAWLHGVRDALRRHPHPSDETHSRARSPPGRAGSHSADGGAWPVRPQASWPAPESRPDPFEWPPS